MLKEAERLISSQRGQTCHGRLVGLSSVEHATAASGLSLEKADSLPVTECTAGAAKGHLALSPSPTSDSHSHTHTTKDNASYYPDSSSLCAVSLSPSPSPHLITTLCCTPRAAYPRPAHAPKTSLLRTQHRQSSLGTLACLLACACRPAAHLGCGQARGPVLLEVRSSLVASRPHGNRAR